MEEMLTLHRCGEALKSEEKAPHDEENRDPVYGFDAFV